MFKAYRQVYLVNTVSHITCQIMRDQCIEALYCHLSSSEFYFVYMTGMFVSIMKFSAFVVID